MSKKLTMRKMKMAVCNQRGNTVAVLGKRNGRILTEKELEERRKNE